MFGKNYAFVIGVCCAVTAFSFWVLDLIGGFMIPELASKKGLDTKAFLVGILSVLCFIYQKLWEISVLLKDKSMSDET